MAKIEITKTELVWPGKYDEDGMLKEVPRVKLPFQVIERVNESRAAREARKNGVQPTLFEVWEGKEGDAFEDGWRNKLIWGDNLLVMGSLLEKFAGKIDLIYIDPPFATGSDFSFTAPIGESGEEITKEQSIIEEKAYRDTWGRGIDSYLEMLVPRVRLMRELLSDRGSLFLHLGVQVNHFMRVVLGEVFGTENVLDEIIWSYGTPSGGRAAGNKIIKAHEYILYAVKRYGSHIYNKEFLSYSEKYINERFIFTDQDGRRYQRRTRGGGKVERQYLDESRGVPLSTVWSDIKQTYAMHLVKRAAEETGFQTQKPEALLNRIISIASNPGDLVADFFCGSGTTLAVAEKLGRRWIGCDLGRWAIHVTRKRLLDIPNCKPFEVLNLGKYERQYWQGVTFAPQRHGEQGENQDKSSCSPYLRTESLEQRIYEYLAFILKLYSAQPVAGMAHLHGKKGKAMVHIGAVDAPVTFDEINQALDECVAHQQTELHVLGWEWEMGLAGPNNDVRKGGLMHQKAKQNRVKLMLLQIPREVMEQQAAAKGDVRFFELAYLEVEINQPKKLTVQVALKDFVIPNTELIPEDVRSKVKKWSDYIDYWAVDWDFQNDTFMQGWVAYRTRKKRELPLISDPHTYEKPGKYCILVKVIDVFGNDTSQAFDVEV
jgi:adenine-specific DNA-methyltransferase